MVYECERCHYRTIFKSNFKNHIKKRIPCPDEFSNISQQEILERFNEIYNAPKKFSCPHCSKAFSHISTLCHHKNQTHPDKRKENIHQIYRDNLTEKINTSNEDKPNQHSHNTVQDDTIGVTYLCQRCHYSTKLKPNFVAHINKRQQCEPLYSNLSKDELVKIHEQQCSAKEVLRVFPCLYCESKYKHIPTLYAHMRKVHPLENQSLSITNYTLVGVPKIKYNRKKKPKSKSETSIENKPKTKTSIENKPKSTSKTSIQKKPTLPRKNNTEVCRKYREKHREKYSAQKKIYYTQKFACSTPNCPVLATIPKYKGYCSRCFMHTFPAEKITRGYKLKEKHVQDFLKESYPNENLRFDTTVGGCSRRRPDCFIDRYTHSIIVEIDENQHNDYDTTCEEVRINELFTDLADRPIVFIRFNPDSYIDTDGTKRNSSFKYHKTLGVPMVRDTEEWNERLGILKDTIDDYLYSISTIPITNVYLFYDEN